MVVSNLSRDAKTAQVRLKLDGLALPAKLTGKDMVTDEDVAVNDKGEMSFELKPFGFRVVWVKP